MTRARLTVITLVLNTLAVACGGEQAEPNGASAPPVRDSAGVRIVENGPPSSAAWRVAASPLFTLGWAADDPSFTGLQSGRIQPDGGALLGDFGAGAIYRVGSDGSVVGTWGRKGEGPGEYQALDAILLTGDTVLVSDGRLNRVTLLSLEGELLSASRQAGAFVHHVSSILSDGRLLLVPGASYRAITETRPEWVFETQPILAAALGSTTADTLAELPHRRRWYGTRAAPSGPVSVMGRAGGFEEGFAWARADRPEVLWYDSSGRLLQVARWDEEPAPLTPEWRARMARVYEDLYRAQGAEEAAVAARLAELEEGFDRHDGPLPYWEALFVDRQGNAWLREDAIPGEPSDRWRVVARDGTLVGWVELPGVVTILDITDDRILAVRMDELEVPAAVMIDLLKPGAG